MMTATEITSPAELASARRAGRYAVRVTGTKYDFTRRYTVVDKTTGRVARQTHGATYERCDAQEIADRLNGIVIDWSLYEDDDL